MDGATLIGAPQGHRLAQKTKQFVLYTVFLLLYADSTFLNVFVQYCDM